MKIPFFDLKRQTECLKMQLDEAYNAILNEGLFIGGNAVSKFEGEFASYSGLSSCVGVANGTDALELTLRALNIGKDDEVIVPAFTWISDADAVVATGAKVVFADVLEEECTIDPEDLVSKITPNTKVVIAVHLYGHAARLTEIQAVLEGTDIALIEDCAQAHGTLHNGQKVGQVGVAATFSFYPSKNLGAYGDAGAVVTNDQKLTNQIRLLANHGQPVHNQHLLRGKNSRLDTLQAALLSVKLKYLDSWVTRRRQIANRYINELVYANHLNWNQDEDSFHLFVVKEQNRSNLINYLEQKGIGSALHYPKSLPETEPYSSHVLPIAKKLASTVLSLPLYPELTDKEVDYIIASVNEFYANQ